jgi:hypothetical protein
MSVPACASKNFKCLFTLFLCYYVYLCYIINVYTYVYLCFYVIFYISVQNSAGVATNYNFESHKFIKLIRGEPHCKAMFIKLRHIDTSVQDYNNLNDETTGFRMK